jgi:hypothetical protein
MSNHLAAPHDFVVSLGGSSTFVSTVNAVSDHFFDREQQGRLPAG